MLALLLALRDSLWFHPAVALVGGVAWTLLAFPMASLVPPAVLGVMPSLDAQSLQELLKILVGSMVTIIALTFSVLMVVLNVVSSRHSPRLVRSVIHDQVSQWTLAIFVATVGFAMSSYIALERLSAGPVVALLSVLALLFFSSSLAGLIYFMHYYTFSLQITNVLHRLYRASAQSLHAALPEPHSVDIALGSGAWPVAPSHPGRRLYPRAVEYVQVCHTDALLRLATRYDLFLVLYKTAGDFAEGYAPLLEVWPPERVNRRIERALARAYFLANDRNIARDPFYGFELLVDVALRALSPAQNDPETAVLCLHYLGALVHHVAWARMPPQTLTDASGTARIRRPAVSFEQILEQTLARVARAGHNQLSVVLALLSQVTALVQATDDPSRRAAMRHLAHNTVKLAERALVLDHERRSVQGALQMIEETLEHTRSVGHGEEHDRLSQPLW